MQGAAVTLQIWASADVTVMVVAPSKMIRCPDTFTGRRMC